MIYYVAIVFIFFSVNPENNRIVNPMGTITEGVTLTIPTVNIYNPVCDSTRETPLASPMHSRRQTMLHSAHRQHSFKQSSE